MNQDLKRRIGRDFLVDYGRSAESHRGAFWNLVQAIEALLEGKEDPGLEAAVEASLTLLEYHDWSNHTHH
jgi:hypothetical protein